MRNLKKNKREIAFTQAPNQDTFENPLKDFANELSFFYFLFPVDILNDIVYQTILYSTQEQPEKPISITLDDIEKFIACALNSLVHVIIGAQNCQFHVFQI